MTDEERKLDYPSIERLLAESTAAMMACTLAVGVLVCDLLRSSRSTPGRLAVDDEEITKEVEKTYNKMLTRARSFSPVLRQPPRMLD